MATPVHSRKFLKPRHLLGTQAQGLAEPLDPLWRTTEIRWMCPGRGNEEGGATLETSQPGSQAVSGQGVSQEAIPWPLDRASRRLTQVAEGPFPGSGLSTASDVVHPDLGLLQWLHLCCRQGFQVCVSTILCFSGHQG